MLADAFKAEGMRFLRQRGAIVWGLVFFPGLMIALVMISAALTRAHGGGSKLNKAGQVAQSVFQNIGYASGVIDQFFLLLLAAAIFAGDYRWETWRLFTPRNSRANLILAKLGVYALAGAAGLVLLAASGVLQMVVGSAIDGSALVWPDLAGDFLPRLARSAATAWLDVLLVGEAALVVAVLTRSNIAAIMVPLGLAAVQGVLITFVVGSDRLHPPLKYLAAMPSLAIDVLRGTVLGPGGETATGAPLAAVVVAAWLGGLLALALWLFRRQDLTRE